MDKNILITGIGGNVGQGILRNIKALDYKIKCIGTNVDLVSPGNYLCDKVYQTPYAYNEDYIPEISKICEKENIDLIIPSTDYEVFYLSQNINKLPKVACSPESSTKIFIDKLYSYQEFAKHDLPFAESCMIVDFHDQFDEYIVKPREGRGSRDLYYNPPNIKDFSNEYMIQKLYKGKEITTAFYITQTNELIGLITFIRELSHGTTSECSVTFEYDTYLGELINKMINCFDIKGSCNIQSIITDDEQIIPFEINCRISGTNSIRSQFGFNDVKYTIDEYLFNKKPSKPIIKRGSAMRILLDIIYPETGIDEIEGSNTNHYIF